MDQDRSYSLPHIIFFPLPALGHVNPMLNLAELLSHAGLNITFLNFHQNLLRSSDIEARFSKFPGFKFKTIETYLPMNVPLCEILEAMKSSVTDLGKILTESCPQITCIIYDVVMGFARDVAIKLGILDIEFVSSNASHHWISLCLHRIADAGQLPIRGEEDMDRLITKVPGMETFLRCRDLPSFCRTSNIEDPELQMVLKETRKSPRAQALILNTFEELEGPILSQIRHHCPKVYTIGPLHLHLKTKLNAQLETHQSSNSLWEVDRSCIKWLDSQSFRSVLYVSFGSIAIMTKEQLMEFWHGIINSKRPYLWVIRDNFMINMNGEKFPEKLKEGHKENGYIVKWAPQEEVLAHKAVGGFLTHNGWNSTLESIVAGVPMICWPYFADQQVNSRFVSEIWKLGLDMKDLCDRKIVEKMVNDLMVNRREEFVKSSAKMAELARKSVDESGSSFCNLNRLIEDIKLMSTNDST